MRLVMTLEAEGEGAWATVLQRLQGFTVIAHLTGGKATVVGEIYGTDDEECILIAGGRLIRIPWGDIEEVEYV